MNWFRYICRRKVFHKIARIAKILNGWGRRAGVCAVGVFDSHYGETAARRTPARELLTFMKAEVLPEQVGIAVPGEAWGTDVLVLTDEQKAQLKALADALVH